MKKHRMKMAMLTLVLSLVAALPTHADVAFDEANFPDANFRSWLSSHFAEAVADGVWTDAELATVTEISCSNQNLESMVGIEHFSNLRKLTYSGSKMTQLDLSKNHLLEEVVVLDSPLRALNVANTALTKLYAAGSKLASLSCEGLSNLSSTSLGYPPQTVALDKVYKMDYNGKTYYFVWLEEEHKNLDQSLAEQMRAYEGEMGNGYVHFDLDRANWGNTCEVFEGTPVAGGLSDGLDANAFPGKVLLLNPETKTFNYGYNATPDRTKGKISMPVTVTWENAVYTTAIGGIPFDEEHFPDANFRANLARNLVAETADNWLTPEELTCEKTKSLILNFYKDMESMEGIQYFTELEDVNFIGTKVKSVDLSQNKKLMWVSCWYSGLMSLDLSNNTALTKTELDPQRVSGLPVNKITVNGKDYYYITIPKFRAFVNDYEGEMSETYVPFSLNRITWGDNCERFNGTPVAGGLSDGLSANTFNGPVLLINPEKKSFTYYYDVNNQIETDGKMEVIVRWELNETPITDGIPFDEEHFPDAKFRSYLAARFPEATADLFWTYDELATVTELYCYNSNIESLVGVEYFNNLVTLHCNHNNIAQLDLSKNHLLANLDVQECNLHALNVANTALTYLNCQRNQLTSLDCTGMDDLKNTTTILQQIVFEKVNKMDYNGNTYYYLWLDEEHKGNEKSLTDLVNAHEGEMGEDYVPFSVDRARMSLSSDFEVFEGTPVAGKLSEGLDANAFAGKVLLLNPETKRFTYAYDATPDRDRRKILMDEIITWEDAEYAPEPVDGIPFDEEHFPDANFRANLARNLVAETADNWLTNAELTCEKTKDLILNFYKDMESMEGIQYFTELEAVNFIGTKVKTADFSKNTKLKSVSGWYSNMMSLDLSQNTALTTADLDPQRVENWPVNKVTVNGKDYYFIGLAKFRNQVNAYEGEMGETYVPFSLGRVTWGDNCELFDEEVPSEGVLSEGLTYETFNHIPVLLIDPEKKSFSYDYDLNNEAGGKMKVIVKWVLEETPLEGIPFDEEHFPDANFRANLARNLMAETADFWLTPEELTCEKTKHLILNFYRDMESMEGIQYFTELEAVNFIGTKVKSADFSQNTKLESVSGWFSSLMSLDLSQNTALTDADLDPQRVENWPVNKITVNGKDYYYIGLAQFADQVKAYEGQMGETYVPFSLDRVTWGDNCELFDEWVPSEGGVLSEGLTYATFNHIPVLLIDPEKTTFTYDYDLNNEAGGKMEVIVKWVLAETPLDGIPFDEEHFPDAAFRANLARNLMAETADFWLTNEELTCEKTKSLILTFYRKEPGMEMKSLQGIHYFSELEYVDIVGTQVEDVDLSQNMKLEWIEGWNCSSLEHIILPATESLVHIDVSNCALKTLDVTHVTKLGTLYCSYNHLTSLDLSKNQLLTTYGFGNQTVNLGECSGSIKRDGTDKNYFFGLKESYEDDIVKSLPKLINDWEAQHTETFVPFSKDRVDWVDGCYEVGSNGHGAPRRAQIEWTPEYPILILTDEPNENEFTYDYKVYIPNDQDKKMTVKATYQKPADEDLLIDTSTAIDTVTADADVVSVRYINMSGVSSNEPWDGVNIVVTTKADGTQSVTKVLR